MQHGEFTSIFTVYPLIIGFIASLLILVFSNRFKGWAHWIAYGVLSLSVIFNILAWTQNLFPVGNEASYWYHHWLGFRQSQINFGLIENPINVLIVLLVTIIMALITLSFDQNTLKSQARFYSGILISLTGISLAWLSLTIWMALAGMGLSLIGSILLRSSQSWSEVDSADVLKQFAWEKTGFYIIACVGAAILSTANPNLILNELLVQKSDIFKLISRFDFSSMFGSISVIVGFFLLHSPFPVRGQTKLTDGESLVIRVLTDSLIMGLSSFALLIKMLPLLAESGLLQVFALIALIIAFCGILGGLFQSDWRKTLLIWLSASFSLSFAAGCLLGVKGAVTLMISSVLSGFVFTHLGDFFSTAGKEPRSDKASNAAWVRFLLVLSLLCGICFYGFLSAGTMMQLLSVVFVNSEVQIVLLLAVFFWMLLHWKTLFILLSKKIIREGSWPHMIVPLIFLLLSLGLLWSGTWTGGVDYVNQMDKISQMGSLLDWTITQSFSEHHLSWEITDELQKKSLFAQFVLILLSFLVAYWMRKRWSYLVDKFPRVCDFWIQSGYFHAGLMQLKVQSVGVMRWTENVIGVSLWKIVIPRILLNLLYPINQFFLILNQWFSQSVLTAVLSLFNRSRQPWLAVQNGNIQWYLSLGMILGLLILVVFSWNIK